MERQENGARRNEPEYRALIGYADCDQHDLERRGDHLPLGKILADGAGGGVVTTFTMGGWRDVTLVSLAKGRVAEKAFRAVS